MSAFLNALQAKAKTIEPRDYRAPKTLGTPGTKSPIMTPAGFAKVPELRIERVINANRIDLFFSEKPSAEIRKEMKDNGFWYRDSDSAWFHKDCSDSRQFLNRLFDAKLPPFGWDTIEPETPAVAPTVPNEPVTMPEDIDLAMKRYNLQVEELKQKLNTDLVQVIWKAVDLLHKSLI